MITHREKNDIQDRRRVFYRQRRRNKRQTKRKQHRRGKQTPEIEKNIESELLLRTKKMIESTAKDRDFGDVENSQIAIQDGEVPTQQLNGRTCRTQQQH